MAKPAQIASEIHMDIKYSTSNCIYSLVFFPFVLVIFVNQFEHKMPHLKKKRGKKEIKQNEKERKEPREGPNTFKKKDLTNLPIYKFESDMK